LHFIQKANLMHPTNKPSPILLFTAFIAIYFIWGTSYLAIRFALKGLQPFTISAFRYLAAGLLLSAWILFKKQKWPEKKDLRVLVISGILMLSGGSGLVVVGEQYVSSGFAAVIMATEPLFFVLLDRGRWNVYFANKWIVGGLLIGFAGIALFAYFAPAEATGVHSRPVLGTLITLASAISWVVGALYANHRLSPNSNTLVNSAVQLLAAGLFSGMIAGCKGEGPALFSQPIMVAAWAGLAYLVVMGSLVAYLSFNWLLTVQPPAIVSTHTYVNPVIAIIIGWLVASEPLSYRQVLALAIVLTGVILTQLNKQKTGNLLS
jgi:drug/metabolite transporter (DMT)-like permease